MADESGSKADYENLTPEQRAEFEAWMNRKNEEKRAAAERDKVLDQYQKQVDEYHKAGYKVSTCANCGHPVALKTARNNHCPQCGRIKYR